MPTSCQFCLQRCDKIRQILESKLVSQFQKNTTQNLDSINDVLSLFISLAGCGKD